MEERVINYRTERNNNYQIFSLTRMGRRMLTLTDLMEMGTISEEIAGVLVFAMSNGFSFITAASPNGAGKSTLMAALLNFVKPGIQIKTYSGRREVELESNQEYFIAHEIYNSPFYSYIWGKAAGVFFSFIRKGTIVSTVHADNLAEMRKILLNPPLSINQKDFNQVDLIIFLKVEEDHSRKISSIYYPNQQNHRRLYSSISTFNQFNRELTNYIRTISIIKKIPQKRIELQIERSNAFIKKLKEKRINTFLSIREEYLNFYQNEFIS